MEQQIVGPLGIWTFPLLNFLLTILVGSPTGFFKQRRFSTRSKEPALQTQARNIEVWEWTDYRGRKRKLVVHREVEE